ncbi:MAG: hypothetical protein ACOYOK_15495, partial [Pseudobdellovibrionaceae bacterium]
MFSILHSFFIFFSFKIVLAGSNHKPVCSDIFSNQQITFSHMVTAANKSENSIQMELNTSVIIEGR